jgi:hypothetical protein
MLAALPIVAGLGLASYARMRRLLDMPEGWGQRMRWRIVRPAFRATGVWLLSIGGFVALADPSMVASWLGPAGLGALMARWPAMFAPDFIFLSPADHEDPIGPQRPGGMYRHPIGPELPYPDLRSRESTERWLDED